MEPMELSLHSMAEAVKKGDLTAESLTKSFLDRAEKLNPQINAYISFNDQALEKARQIDLKRQKGEALGALAGVPLAIKDLFCTKGQVTTAASKILEGFKPPYNSTVVQRLEDADAICLGKANLDEFAMGSSNETSFFGACKNPWDLTKVPGGSSGGSAAAVSARMAAASMGTDTGGSIRQPASFCGLVGMKPTYGRVSRYGIVAFASSLDQAGPMTKSVEDSALILEVISGQDKMDSTTANEAVPQWSQALKKESSKKVIGLPKEYFSQLQLDEDVQSKTEDCINALKEQGYEFKEVSIPLMPHSVPIYYLVCASEASSNLSRYDGVRFGYRSDFNQKPAESIQEFYARTRSEGFGEEVKRRILMGTFSLSSGYYDAYYLKACQVRRLLQEEFLSTLKDCDLLLAPVSTSSAFTIGERIDDPLTMYNNDIFTTAASLSGLPAMTVPLGLGSKKMPVGIQLIGKTFDEETLFQTGRDIEQAFGLMEVPPCQ